jgi:hypothetical protein
MFQFRVSTPLELEIYPVCQKGRINFLAHIVVFNDTRAVNMTVCLASI